MRGMTYVLQCPACHRTVRHDSAMVIWLASWAHYWFCYWWRGGE
jgi:hypothetical protein